MNVRWLIGGFGLFLLTGTGLPAPGAEEKLGRRELEQTIALADKGNAMAQCALGARFESGRGVLKDLEQAVKWYRKAAEQGDALGQCALGACYDDGRGVEKDLAEAVKWYTKSATQECARAQFNLGACYADGHGVAQDRLLAHHWYTRAVLNHYEPAKKALARLERKMTREQLAQARKAAALLQKKTP